MRVKYTRRNQLARRIFFHQLTNRPIRCFWISFHSNTPSCRVLFDLWGAHAYKRQHITIQKQLRQSVYSSRNIEMSFPNSAGALITIDYNGAAASNDNCRAAWHAMYTFTVSHKEFPRDTYRQSMYSKSKSSTKEARERRQGILFTQLSVTTLLPLLHLLPFILYYAMYFLRPSALVLIGFAYALGRWMKAWERMTFHGYKN